MATNATNWFKKINAVLATIGGEFGKVPDLKTYNVMYRVINDLMRNKSVGGSLATSLVQNIAIRVGPREFAHEGLVTLTKNQRAYARKMGWACLPSFEELYGQPETGEPEQAAFQIDGFSGENDAIVRGFLSNADEAQKAALVAWIKSQDEPAPLVAEVVEAKAVASSKTGRLQDALTIWVKENNGTVRATGNLDIGGNKFCLNFSDFHSALDRIPDTRESRSWRAVMAGEVADVILPVERNSVGVASCSTMSGLFAATDSRGYKAPIHNSTAVILEWDAARPVRAHLFDGDERTTVEINQETSERFKGTVKFAA